MTTRIPPSTISAEPARPAATPEAMPTLVATPGTRILWRAPSVTQWELGGRSLVLEGADNAVIDALVRPRTPEPPEVAALTALRIQLHDAGYLWEPHAVHQPAAAAGLRTNPPLPERLIADIGALAARHGDDASEVMAARKTRTVQVVGSDRIGPTIAALLAAAGVGHVELPLDGTTRLHQAMPGGLLPQDEGRPWREAVDDAVRRAAPESGHGFAEPDAASSPDVVVLATNRPLSDDTRSALHHDLTPHLCVGVDGGRAVIGPMVVPRRTSCVRCLELHRRDRDPLWWALAAQLSTAPLRAEPSDVAVCAIAAGFGAMQVLALLDGEWPTTCDGTVEFALPDWRLRRRTRTRHPECDCAAAA